MLLSTILNQHPFSWRLMLTTSLRHTDDPMGSPGFYPLIEAKPLLWLHKFQVNTTEQAVIAQIP